MLPNDKYGKQVFFITFLKKSCDAGFNKFFVKVLISNLLLFLCWYKAGSGYWLPRWQSLSSQNLSSLNRILEWPQTSTCNVTCPIHVMTAYNQA